MQNYICYVMLCKCEQERNCPKSIHISLFACMLWITANDVVNNVQFLKLSL